ncbi:MAG: non-ribosomal peptide synthetase, partial [bacterium]|nr:non-ribosomal peptide synthetase [bacterium]
LEMEEKFIGIDANFFHLGGHSLKATLFISKLHNQLHIKIPLIEIFTTPTIRELAGYVKTALENNRHSSEVIDTAPEQEYYNVSSAQKRLYIMQRMDPESTAYNIPAAVKVVGRVDRTKFEDTFQRLIRRHESLRTSFKMIAGLPVQKIHEKVEFEIEYGKPGDGRWAMGDREKEGHKVGIAASVSGFIRPFDFSHAPLLRVGLIKIEETRYILLVDMHHIISDGISLEIFVTEFMSLYMGEELPPPRTQYKDFAYWQNTREHSETMKQQEAYWLTQLAGEIPILDLPADFERPPEKSFAGRVINFEIGNEETQSLNHLARVEGVTLSMLLAALFNVLMAKISGKEDILIGTPVAGRKHADSCVGSCR